MCCSWTSYRSSSSTRRSLARPTGSEASVRAPADRLTVICPDPAEPRHREIQDDRIGPRAFDLEERLKHVKALEADVLTEYGTQLGIIVDDEHGLQGGVLRNGLLL